jgi:hypothetical protein
MPGEYSKKPVHTYCVCDKCLKLSKSKNRMINFFERVSWDSLLEGEYAMLRLEVASKHAPNPDNTGFLMLLVA